MSLPEIFITPGCLFKPVVDAAGLGIGCAGDVGFCPGPAWAAVQTVHVASITSEAIVFRMILSRRL
jgi:hypothetical protein